MSSKKCHLFIYVAIKQASLVTQTLQMQVWSLGLEDAQGKNGYLLQYSWQENSMDRGAWRATVHAVAESDMTEQRTLSIHFHDFPQWELLPSSWGQQPSHTNGVLGKIYRNPHWPNCFWIQCLHGAEIISKAHRGQCSKDIWKTWSQESSGPDPMPSSAP